MLISFSLLQSAALVERGGRGRKARERQTKSYQMLQQILFHPHKPNAVQLDRWQTASSMLELLFTNMPERAIAITAQATVGCSVYADRSVSEAFVFLPSNPFNGQSTEVSLRIPWHFGFKGRKQKPSALLLSSLFSFHTLYMCSEHSQQWNDNKWRRWVFPLLFALHVPST